MRPCTVSGSPIPQVSDVPFSICIPVYRKNVILVFLENPPESLVPLKSRCYHTTLRMECVVLETVKLTYLLTSID